MRTAALFLCIAFSAFGTDYVLYQKNSSPVTNQVVLYRPLYAPAVPNVNYALLSYSLKPAASNWNGVLPSLATNTATIQWCKVSNNLVVPMTAAESNSIVSARAAESLAARNAREAATKLEATNELDDVVFTVTGRELRALVKLINDNFNQVRTNPAAVLPARTMAQVRDALRNEINAQPDTQ